MNDVIRPSDANSIETMNTPVYPGGVAYWTGPDVAGKVTEWATLRADEFRRIEREARNWRMEHSRG